MANQPDKHGFAIIGCGQMGHLHARRLLADGRGRVAALYDQSNTMAEQLCDGLPGDVRVFSTWDELMNRTEIEAAIICTPTTFHFEQAKACLDRGWHVLCEKPLADSRERILGLINASKDGRLNLSVAYQRRSWATYRRMHDEFRSGRCGELQSIHSFNAERWQQTIAGTWRDDPTFNAGGFVTDAGSHKIDAAFFVTGRHPTEVFATSDKCRSRVEIRTSVVAELEGRVPLVINFIGNSESFFEDLHVHCSKADLILRDERLWIARDNQLEEISIPPDEIGLDSKTNPVSAFVDLIEGQSPNIAPPECALPVFDFTKAVLESSATGQSVRISSR